jgi:hypothetical protein
MIAGRQELSTAEEPTGQMMRKLERDLEAVLQ